MVDFYLSSYLWNTESVTICLSSFVVLNRRWITPVGILRQPAGSVSFFIQINTANEDRRAVSLLAFHTYSPCHRLTVMQQYHSAWVHFVLWLPKVSVTGIPHKDWGGSQISENVKKANRLGLLNFKNTFDLVKLTFTHRNYFFLLYSLVSEKSQKAESHVLNFLVLVFCELSGPRKSYFVYV